MTNKTEPLSLVERVDEKLKTKYPEFYKEGLAEVICLINMEITGEDINRINDAVYGHRKGNHHFSVG